MDYGLHHHSHTFSRACSGEHDPMMCSPNLHVPLYLSNYTPISFLRYFQTHFIPPCLRRRRCTFAIIIDASAAHCMAEVAACDLGWLSPSRQPPTSGRRHLPSTVAVAASATATLMKPSPMPSNLLPPPPPSLLP